MDKCIFCLARLNPGSREHIFPSALGGKLVTFRSTCLECNNHFSTSEGDKIEDALADGFKFVRCALAIWTGRGKPPPTILRAGRLSNGLEYDLAPGFVPLPRQSKIPDISSVGKDKNFTLCVRDKKELRRILDITKSKGERLHIKRARLASSKAPCTSIRVIIEGSKIFRAIGKIALTGACVLYGNEQVRLRANRELAQAIRSGEPDILNYAGWDYTNAWPVAEESTPHKSTLLAKASGFEHSLVITDIGPHWVAYITLFGQFRFSVRLGSSSGLASKGLSINPRQTGRFVLRGEVPESYCPKHSSSFKEEFDLISRGIKEALSSVISIWQEESQAKYREEVAKDFVERVMCADTVTDREEAIRRWTERLTQIELGETWEEELDKTILDAGDD